MYETKPAAPKRLVERTLIAVDHPKWLVEIKSIAVYTIHTHDTTHKFRQKHAERSRTRPEPPLEVHPLSGNKLLVDRISNNPILILIIRYFLCATSAVGYGVQYLLCAVSTSRFMACRSSLPNGCAHDVMLINRCVEKIQLWRRPWGTIKTKKSRIILTEIF